MTEETKLEGHVSSAQETKIFEIISNFANRSEKTSWNRKRDNIEKFIGEIQPLEEEILSLMAKKIPIADKIQVLRNEMVENCIHPLDHLVLKDTHIECKFCNKEIGLPHGY